MKNLWSVLALVLVAAAPFSAVAENAPLKALGPPSGFRDAAKETLDGAKAPFAYGLVIGDEGETNETWVLETEAGFEEAMSRIFSWLSAGRLKVSDSACSSQAFQNCELSASRDDILGLALYLADKKGVPNRRVLIVRVEGLAIHPN